MWIVPAADYEIQPGDRIQLTLTLGPLGPPLEWIQEALSYTRWVWVSGRYEGSDLILELERAPRDPDEIEIIQAGAVPAWIVALLVGSVITLLIVKDFRIWAGNGIGIETTSSFSGLVFVAALGLGFLFFTQKK